LLTLLVYALLELLQWFLPTPRHRIVTELLILLAISYCVVWGLSWARKRLLWSLRNQLAVVYVFIAVVPVMLLLVMLGLAAYLLYWQLGSYVLYTQMQAREYRVTTVAAALATSLAAESIAGHIPVSSISYPEHAPAVVEEAKAELPGLQIQIRTGEKLLEKSTPALRPDFRGAVLTGKTLTLRAVEWRAAFGGRLLVIATVPVTPELLGTLSPELGPIQFEVVRPTSGLSGSRDIVNINGQNFALVERVATRDRPQPPAANLFDKRISGMTTLKILDMSGEGPGREAVLYASFVTRPSLLNRRLFSPLGSLGSVAVTLLMIVGVVFLFLEFAALGAGVFLTRTITTAVDNLYLAARHVQSGDLSFRVPVQQRDELGVLGDSFNSMMQSVSTVVAEQRERQRLENELSIAREVQTQLFPRELPKLPGVELDAICRPARVVSGDYYDFLTIGPNHLAIVLADISGKGISAALLMASMQAALHSELFRDGLNRPEEQPAIPNTATVVAQLNRHLYRRTSDDRYATCFFAVYDAQRRRLCYTNAGHFPPLYIVGDRVEKLEVGGTVVGLFYDATYELMEVEVVPGSMLLVYSDGLIEPTNAQGEEFGVERVAAVASRHRDASPHVIAETLLRAAQDWSASPEQADDMTVIVAKFSEVSELSA
jgi:phosphoserine phosphatase RsbU/P